MVLVAVVVVVVVTTVVVAVVRGEEEEREEEDEDEVVDARVVLVLVSRVEVVIEVVVLVEVSGDVSFDDAISPSHFFSLVMDATAAVTRSPTLSCEGMKK